MYFKTIQINDHIYQIKDPLGVLTTLVIGKSKAMLIDTAYGIGDLLTHVRTLTNLDLIVVNTHGHMDHSCGNYQFDKVYIHEKDINLCIKHNSIPWRKKNLTSASKLNVLSEDFDKENYINMREGNLVTLNYNDIFDLGGICIKVINMEGHTTGSVGFLIIEDKILVTSDGACPFVWIFLEESTTVETYVNMLKETIKLDFDYILVGHGVGKLLPRQKIIDFYDVARTIDLDKSVRVYFNNFDDVESYCYTTGEMYNQDHVGVVFDPKKLK